MLVAGRQTLSQHSSGKIDAHRAGTNLAGLDGSGQAGGSGAALGFADQVGKIVSILEWITRIGFQMIEFGELLAEPLLHGSSGKL